MRLGDIQMKRNRRAATATVTDKRTPDTRPVLFVRGWVGRHTFTLGGSVAGGCPYTSLGLRFHSTNLYYYLMSVTPPPSSVSGLIV